MSAYSCGSDLIDAHSVPPASRAAQAAAPRKLLPGDPHGGRHAYEEGELSGSRQIRSSRNKKGSRDSESGSAGADYAPSPGRLRVASGSDHARHTTSNAESGERRHTHIQHPARDRGRCQGW